MSIETSNVPSLIRAPAFSPFTAALVAANPWMPVASTLSIAGSWVSAAAIAAWAPGWSEPLTCSTRVVPPTLVSWPAKPAHRSVSAVLSASWMTQSACRGPGRGHDGARFLARQLVVLADEGEATDLVQLVEPDVRHDHRGCPRRWPA